MEGGTDLQTKYYKVATEYSKLRSLVPVLKKAFTDEQQKTNELKQILREKDTSLRIAAAETDSLSFRNHHLMCRLTKLLQELEDVKNPHKKGDSKNHQEDQVLQQTMTEEFNKMLEQNAALISTLSETQQKHERELNELLEEVNVLKLENLKLKNNDFQKKTGFEDGSSQQEMTENISHYGSLSGTQNKGEICKDDDMIVGSFENRFKLNDNSYKKDKKASKDISDSVSYAIQKALEEQLLETQQVLQKSKSEYDNLLTMYKLLETKYKDLKEKSKIIQPSEGTLEGSINFIPEEEALAREREIKRCFQHKIDLVSAEAVQWKSKLQMFEGECHVLKLRLDSEISAHNELKDALKNETENSQKVKDELATTAASYETQLSTMSEHLASLNDVITRQKETIDDLQYHIDQSNKKWRK